jgi:putative ABC transport system permease protein
MIQDIRYALRTFVQAPGFAVVTILVLALGIGANTAIFSVVNSALIRPLPYDHSERLVSLAETRKGGHSMHVAGPNFRDWRTRADAFEGLAAYYSGAFGISGGKEPERIQAAAVGRGFFSVMGAHPILGRTFLAEEEKVGGEPVAVIGESYWRRGFDSNPNVLGKVITAAGTKYSIVGVVPEAFDFPRLSEVWVPLERQADDSGRSAHNYLVVGRLRSGVSLEGARTQMTAIMETLERAYPDSNKDLRARVTPLQQQAASGIRPTLMLLLGSVGFVLLISCMNVANLLLARAASRRREIAIRTALGARKARLLRQLLTESMLLSLSGGVLGLLLAAWTNKSLISLIPAEMLPAAGSGLDVRVLLFALGASLFTGLLFGIAPALFTARADVNHGLKASSRGVAGGAGAGLRNALIASEIALSFVLLAAAGLMTKSLVALESVDPGFDAKGVLVAELSFPSVDWQDLAPYAMEKKPLPDSLIAKINAPARSFETLLDTLGREPGILGVGVSSTIPFAISGRNGGFEIEGRPKAGGMEEANYLDYTLVSEDFFRLMGIHLKQGRVFNLSDRQSPDIAIIDESAARKFWPGESPLGHRIQFAGFEMQPKWLTIVGVVAGIRDRTLGDEPAMATYVPFYQNPLVAGDLSVFVKSQPGFPAGPKVRAAIRSLNNETPIKTSSLESITRESTATARLRTVLIAIFALFALGLAAMGIYGVISNTVNQRTQEIGVRMALGASPAEVLRMLLAQAGKLTGIGLAAGLLGAIAITRVLRSFLYGVSPADPSIYAALALALGIAGVLAGLAPARRAARLDPVKALREE